MVKPKLNKRQSYWREKDIENALHKVRNGGALKGVARKYGMSDGTWQKRLEGKVMTGSGSKTALTAEEEKDLAECITVLCEAGFSPSVDEIKSLAQDYITAKKIKTPFKDGRPGKDWFHAFMKRKNLSIKKQQ